MNEKIGKREFEELEKVSKNIDSDLKKIQKGYPIQYLIRYVDFYGYKINVNQNVLIPRPETEYLVEKIIKYTEKYNFINPKILEIGTGSGCISIALNKEISGSILFATDISAEAIKVAKQNSLNNTSTINFINTNIMDDFNENIDILVSNPPYIGSNDEIEESVKKYEPNIALFAEENGLSFYKIILNQAINVLNRKNMLAFEIGENQGQELKNYAANIYKNAHITVEKDLVGKDRYLFIFNNCE